MLPDAGMIEEQRQLINQLEGLHSHYGNFHAINLLTELEAILPEDKAKLLSIIAGFLSPSPPLQQNFILGRQLHRSGRLAGFQESPAFQSIRQQVAKLRGEGSESLEAVFHDLRNRII